MRYLNKIYKVHFVSVLALFTAISSWAGRFDDLNKPEASEEWIRLSVQNPDEVLHRKANDKEKVFLRNTHYGLVSVFDPWFENAQGVGSLSFEQMLRSQHVNTKFGRDGKPYGGFTPASHGLTETKQDFPGNFRFENRVIGENGDEFPSDAIPIPLRIEKKISPSERLNQLRADYKANPAPDKMIEETNEEYEAKYGDTKQGKGLFFDLYKRENFGKNYNLDVIRMPGIDVPIPAFNQIYEHSMHHIYPHPSGQLKMIAEMKRLMTELRDLSLNLSRPLNHEVRSRALDLIEKYLYLGDNAHLHESINHSILMTQINSMLSRFGFNGIGPSNIDYVAIMEQFPEWRTSFRGKLAQTNPDIGTFGVPLLKSPLLSIHAHIADYGNLFVPERQVIVHPDPNSKNKQLEGLTLYPQLPSDVEVQYMGHIEGTETKLGGDTPWQNAGTYLGTMGEGRALEGVAFRLVSKSGAPVPYQINYKVKLGGSRWTRECSNGEYCGTSGKHRAITQLKIWISEDPESREKKSIGEQSSFSPQAVQTATVLKAGSGVSLGGEASKAASSGAAF